MKITEELDKSKREGEGIVKQSKVLLEWSTFDRLSKESSKYSIRKIGVIALFIAFIFLILKDFWLIIIIAVLYFVVYVFITTPSQKITHKITNNGIFYASEHLYKWSELLNFYIENRDDHRLLVVNAKKTLPGRLFLVLADDINNEKVIKVMNEYLSIIETPPISQLDKVTKFISKKFNI